MFFYGAQYFRPPTPRREDWRDDFARMKEAHFNTVKLWPMWRWNHQSPETLVWDELDELMNLASEFGLRVVLNPIFDTAPVWFFQKYPDCMMEAADGRKAMPHATPCRQIGGADSVCFHYPQYKTHSEVFLSGLVERFKDHPALYAWDVWNEPWLTGGFGDAYERSLCYCPASLFTFKSEMENRYVTIEKLNEAWGRNYLSFADIELPRCKGTLTDNLDFRRFFTDTLTSEMSRRAKIVRLRDPNHLVMSHSAMNTVNTDPISMANDDWGLAECLDIYGASAGGYGREEAFSPSPRYEDLPYEVAGVRSAAGEKPIWVPESHVLDGMASHLYGTRPMDHLMRWTTQMVAGGTKGILYWQYRPELLGIESPAWGITNLDGTPGRHYEMVAQIGGFLEEFGDYIATAKKPTSEIAILYSPDNALYAWLTDKSMYLKESMRGIFRAFYDHNYAVDFLHADRLERLNDYRLVYFPFPVMLNESQARALEGFVRDGGTLVVEAQLGAFRRENGFHSLHVPGFGLDDVFDCVETELRLGDYQSSADLMITANESFSIQGNYAKESFTTSKGEVLGRFADGSLAIVSSACGKGKAILIGSYLGAAVFRRSEHGTPDFLADLAKRVGCRCTADFESVVPVRVDVLNGDGFEIVTLVNHHKIPATVRVQIQADRRDAIEMLSRRSIALTGQLEWELQPESGTIFLVK